MASGSRDDKSQCIKEEIHSVMKDLQELCLSNNQTSDIIENSNSNVQTTQINNSNIHELHNQDLVNNADDQNLTVTLDENFSYTSDICECESFDYETSLECLIDKAAEDCYDEKFSYTSDICECESFDYETSLECSIDKAAEDCYVGDLDYTPFEELTCEDASDIYERELFDYETSLECLIDKAAEDCYDENFSYTSDIYECESFDYETSLECSIDKAAEDCYVGDLDNPEIYDDYEPEDNDLGYY